MSQIELVTLSGHDQQGLMSGVLDILANYGANILDIGESVIYSNIILGILVETSDEADDEKRRQNLKDFVKEKNLSISFSSIDFPKPKIESTFSPGKLFKSPTTTCSSMTSSSARPV